MPGYLRRNPMKLTRKLEIMVWNPGMVVAAASRRRL